MIRDTLLNGIADDEIRREILGSADLLTRAVNEIVALVESKEMARNAVPRPRPHLCQPFSAYMTQTTEHVVMQPHAGNPTIYLIGQNSRVVLSASDFFSSTKKGLVVGIPNLIPCVECYRTKKRQRRHLSLKVGPSPPEPGLQTLEVTSPADPQLSSVRTNLRPISRHRPNKCNTPLSAVHRNATMQGPHYIFKDGQWATAHMREHPKVQVTISVDRAQAHGESTSVRATIMSPLSLTPAPK